MASQSICHILREREIFGSKFAQTALRKLDVYSSRSLELLHERNEVNSRLADLILTDYKEKLTTTGVTKNEILEMEQVERSLRPLLPYRFQAMANWWDFFQKLVSLACQERETVNCVNDYSVQSILKSQRFSWLVKTYMHHAPDQSDEEDEWWCDQLTKLFEQHQYNIS